MAVRCTLSILGRRSDRRNLRRSVSGSRILAQSCACQSSSSTEKTRKLYLADVLQDGHGQPEVAYVEGWQNQFDDTKMAVAQLQALATRLTPAMLA